MRFKKLITLAAVLTLCFVVGCKKNDADSSLNTNGGGTNKETEEYTDSSADASIWADSTASGTTDSSDSPDGSFDGNSNGGLNRPDDNSSEDSAGSDSGSSGSGTDSGSSSAGSGSGSAGSDSGSSGSGTDSGSGSSESVPAAFKNVVAVLKAQGTIAANPSLVTAIPSVNSSNVKVETVSSVEKDFIAVTLNARLSTVNASDITFTKTATDWNTLSSSTDKLVANSSYATVNSQGKTVIIYKVSKENTNKTLSSSELKIADNYLSWQMDHGGWDKGVSEQAKSAWNGKDKKNKFSGWYGKNGEMLGTIDNDATYTQMRQIAAAYRQTKDAKYQKSVLKGLDFIFKLQYSSGGFAQVYPRRGNYSDYVTFNDDAMINVLVMLQDMRDGNYPFDSDIITDSYMAKIDTSISKAIDYILKSQITSSGKLTAWCAQHHPTTYAPVGARAFELPSISGCESVGIVKFLLNQEQTPAIKKAVEGAIEWFKASEVKGIKYIRNDSNGVYFVADSNSSTWYRFYEIGTNKAIFCDRDGIKKYNILEIGEERRHGYSWAGTYPQKLLKYYNNYNPSTDKITAKIVGTGSKTHDNKTFAKGNLTYGR